jgi:SAM-dependent methyltransferase
VEGYGPASYGDGMADVYDEWYPGGEDVAAAVDALARLAGTGPVLELGVGTGRLALPLAARGLEVVGVDASAAMVARMATKPGHERVAVVIGPMEGEDPPGPFRLVFSALNTFFNLVSAQSQDQCMVSVARRLHPEGRFLIEAFVPDGAPAPRSVEIRSMQVDRLVLRVTVTDAAQHTADGHFVELADGAPVRLRPWAIRYAAPDELDAMAARAGLRLEQRSADWTGTPFGPDDDHHVSVYRLDPRRKMR